MFFIRYVDNRNCTCVCLQKCREPLDSGDFQTVYLEVIVGDLCLAVACFYHDLKVDYHYTVKMHKIKFRNESYVGRKIKVTSNILNNNANTLILTFIS